MFIFFIQLHFFLSFFFLSFFLSFIHCLVCFCLSCKAVSKINKRKQITICNTNRFFLNYLQVVLCQDRSEIINNTTPRFKIKRQEEQKEVKKKKKRQKESYKKKVSLSKFIGVESENSRELKLHHFRLLKYGKLNSGIESLLFFFEKNSYSSANFTSKPINVSLHGHLFYGISTFVVYLMPKSSM